MSVGLVACGGKDSDTPASTDEPVAESTTGENSTGENSDTDNKDDSTDSEKNDETKDEANKTDSGENGSGETASTEPASSEWSSQGAFIDDLQNHLLIYHMTVEEGYEKDGWSVTFVSGEKMYGGELELGDGKMTGSISSYGDDGSVEETMDVTLTEQNGQVTLQTSDGKEYIFRQDDTDYTEANGDLLPYFQYNEIYGDKHVAADAAAYDYLAFEKKKDSDPSHAVIPYVNVVAVDDTNEKDALIYGDYYIGEYEKDGDTLVEVSGSHCPGVIHAERFGEGETAIYSATGMDEVLTDDDLKQVFGKNLKKYEKAVADDKKTHEKIAQVIADYVKANNIEVTKYRMTGEKAKKLP